MVSTRYGDGTTNPPPTVAPQETLRVRADHSILPFLGRRLGTGVVTLLVASIIIFLGTSVIPGSPAGAVLGRQASPEQIARINHELGFDAPWYSLYAGWLSNVVRGDLGDSAVAVVQGRENVGVWTVIRGPLVNTLTLALIVVGLLIPISLAVGLLCGVLAGRWPDHLISTTTLIFIALPEFVIGAILILVFSVHLDILPPVSLLAPGDSPLAHPDILVMPVLTLLAVSIAFTVRLVRVGTIEVMDSDYVQMARLHGIPESHVLTRYILRNALAPSVQIFALSIQYLFGGVVVTEMVFNYPGLGKELVDAVLSNDTTLVQAIAMILATIYIAINIIADVAVVLLVPKLRTRA